MKFESDYIEKLAKIIADNGYIFGQSHFTAEKNASEIYEIFCKTVRKMTQI